MLPLYVPLLLLIPILALWRLHAILPRDAVSKKPRKRPTSETSRLVVFLGSGGHTQEMISLLATLPLERYTPRLYLYTQGDGMSLRKALEFEAKIAASDGAEAKGGRKLPFETKALPRARRVGQSYSSAIFTTSRTFVSTLSLVFSPFFFTHIPWPSFLPQSSSSPSSPNDQPTTPPTHRCQSPTPSLLLINGPSTSITLLLPLYILRFLGLPSPRVIYLESFARTKSLSLSGRIVRGLVDRFLVQWEASLTANGGGRGECVGIVV